MKAWTEDQRKFIMVHLQVDMTARELARIFKVAPADIWQVAKRKGNPLVRLFPSAFHSPGGGCLLAYWGIRGATIFDAYEPEITLPFSSPFAQP